jgi:hypothetical protein
MSINLQALVVDPRRPNSSGPRTITDDLTTLQGLVGGYLQAEVGIPKVSARWSPPRSKLVRRPVCRW